MEKVKMLGGKSHLLTEEGLRYFQDVADSIVKEHHATLTSKGIIEKVMGATHFLYGEYRFVEVKAKHTSRGWKYTYSY